MKLRHLPELLIIPLSPVGLTTIAIFCGLYFFLDADYHRAGRRESLQ